jgi:hypothetical protein
MRSLGLRGTRRGNKDMWLNEFTAQGFNFQRLRSKASPIHPSFSFQACARFFHTFPLAKGGQGGIIKISLQEASVTSFILFGPIRFVKSN